MSEYCKLILDNEIYYPGQTISGKVECFFKTEKKIRGIYVKFKGQAYTFWRYDDTSYSQTEKYLEVIITLKQGEDLTIPPGNYVYRFTYFLPENTPSTFKRRTGNIKYSAMAVVDLPGKIDFTSKQKFTVASFLDLNTFESLKSPLEKCEEKFITSLFSNGKPILFTVKLPVTGFSPSQVINFSANVNNMSNIKTSGLQFKIVQIFEYYDHTYKDKEEIVILKSFTIKDSFVLSTSEKSWNLEVQLPPDIFIPNLECCNIIKTFCELRGRVLLPFPIIDLKAAIPFSIGHVPIQKATSAASNNSYKEPHLSIGWEVV